MAVVITDREVLARDLWEYGEDDLANQARELSDLTLGRIGVLAGRLLLSDGHATASGAGPTVAKACALAAVEVIEGAARPLKRRRRRVRKQPSAPMFPEPDPRAARNLFLDVCTSVAAEFDASGFRFAPSGPHMSRPWNRFRFGVSFEFRRGVVSLYAHVQSRDLRAWRKHHGQPDGGYLGAGQLGNLRENRGWLEWELIDTVDAPAVERSVIGAVRNIALPWFALFEDEAQLAQLLESAKVPGCEGLTPIEWMLAVDRRRSAERHGTALLASAKWNRRAYEHELIRLSVEGIDAGPTFGVGEGLAYANVAYGLAFGS
jgi:hypothetical protein